MNLNKEKKKLQMSDPKQPKLLLELGTDYDNELLDGRVGNSL